jgi:alanine-synthesizing transaminase
MIVQNSQEILTRLGLPIICDEVFAPFTYAAPHTPPLGALHPELPVFHLNGISKLFALPDMKLGWVAFTGDDKEIYAGRLELLNDTFLGCNSLSQALLPTLFERGQPFIKEMQERVRYNFDFALGELAKCPAFDLAALPPDGGYYLFPKVRDWRDEDALVLYLLEQHGVLVHPGYFYGYEGNGAHVMLSCLTEPAKFAEGIRRLTAGLEARG